MFLKELALTTLKQNRGVFLLLVFLVHLCGGAEPTTRLAGTVTDSEGVAIPRASIHVYWDPSGAAVGLKDNIGVKHELTLLTNQKGEFVAEVPPGFYDLLITAPAFSPECRKIRLKVGHVENYKVSLRIAPLVTNELGDTFPTK
jgi:hypothetical protein